MPRTARRNRSSARWGASRSSSDDYGAPKGRDLLRFNSLSTRLIIAVVATATVAFAASFGLTIVRLDRGLERQAEQLGKLSEEKLAQRLDGEARLAGARVEGMLATAGTRLESIAQRADIAKAISSEIGRASCRERSS